MFWGQDEGGFLCSEVLLGFRGRDAAACEWMNGVCRACAHA